jgi:hypothetical protein
MIAAMPPRRTLVARTLLVLVVAVAFRCWKLPTLPVGFSEDEAYGCRNAARFAAGVVPLELLRLYPEELSQQVVNGYQPGLYYLWPVTLFRLFGYSPVVWRLSSVIPSLAMVALLYPFGRRVLGERTAFFAALLLAASRWHASEARWGWLVTAAWPFLLAGALLFLSGQRRDRPLLAALGGALSALPGSFYPSALAFALVPLPAAFLARPLRPRVLAGWASGFVVGALPTVLMAMHQPTELLARGRAASVFADAGSDPVLLFVLGNVVHYSGLLFFRGDPLSWHTLPGTPALDPACAVAFVGGLFLALRRPRRPVCAATLGILGAGFAIGLLSQTTDAPNQYRVGFAVVAVVILAAIGLGTAARLLGRRGLRGARALPAIAIALSAILNGWFLFASWPGHESSFRGSGGRYTALAAEIERLSGSGVPIAVSPAVVTDRLRLDLALARSLEDAARAGTSARIGYRYSAASSAEGARILPPDARDGDLVRDPWGEPLYRVATAAPPPASAP